ncbi:MAG TPA: tryptophan synthase subunit alpha [Sedimentisphaerales bacterium]|nr:tryptophan synthase subunit alpha [Sedimentisphaerales bacterium]
MKTYKQVFGEMKRAALIPFFIIGDPDFDTSIELVKTAADAGADVIELGVAFSDPIADGPAIQKASARALAGGMTVRRAVEFIAKIKAYRDIPIGLLMYYNLLLQYGTERFFADCRRAGVNSVLVADVNVDDADEIAVPAKKAGLDTVFMVTPNTEDERIRKVAAVTTGFIYTVSVMGVTGARAELDNAVEPLIRRIKAVTKVPVCVGFGISGPRQAADAARAGADGVIIGSRIVQFIEDNLADRKKMVAEVAGFVSEVKKAIAAV